jgi:hypothetical protein
MINILYLIELVSEFLLVSIISNLKDQIKDDLEKQEKEQLILLKITNRILLILF